MTTKTTTPCPPAPPPPVVDLHHMIDGIVDSIDALRLLIEDYIVARAAAIEANRALYIEKVGNPVEADMVIRQRILGAIFNNLLDFSDQRAELRAHLTGPALTSTDAIIQHESDLQDLIMPEPPPGEGEGGAAALARRR